MQRRQWHYTSRVCTYIHHPYTIKNKKEKETETKEDKNKSIEVPLDNTDENSDKTESECMKCYADFFSPGNNTLSLNEKFRL